MSSRKFVEWFDEKQLKTHSVKKENGNKIENTKIVNEKSWKEFKDSGLLWFVNSILHVFGWAIVLNYENDKITKVYPARIKFRGFSEDVNTDGYKKLSKYMDDNSKDLLKESEE